LGFVSLTDNSINATVQAEFPLKDLVQEKCLEMLKLYHLADIG